MMAVLFIGFVVATAAAVIAACAGKLGRRAAIGVAVGLAAWFTCVWLLGALGILADTAMRPPGIAFVLIPVVLFLVIFVARWSAARRMALAFPLPLLLGAQSFRIGVELFLHQLWLGGLVPKMLTFEGANVDIYIGASAPIIAWISYRRAWGIKLALAWNVLGLLALTNVVVRAVLTAPGPLNLIHAEVSNRMISTIPYTFIPAFFVPLAVVLHVLALRRILASR